jgi:K+ transporter
MYDYDYYFIELLLDNEKSKIIFYRLITIYLVIEFSFLAANITKFTEGGYVTLLFTLSSISNDDQLLRKNQ